MTKTAVTVLGATGSIGVSTLDVIERHPDQYSVFALTANTNIELMLEQCRRFRPSYVVMVVSSAAADLRRLLKSEGLSGIEVLEGTSALEQVTEDADCDVVMAAIVGAAGLLPAMAAAKAGKRILLANKEVLVMSGQLFMQAVKDGGATLLPVDSEHNAIWQCLPNSGNTKYNAYSGIGRENDADQAGVLKILLTASGGPFRILPMSQFSDITPEQACAHPNWDMGKKISVDSATMMNKGLELIEACWLFQVKPDQVDIVIHPESIIHSMVSYSDGSTIAQMGNPDMRTPIAYALSWPERIESGVEPLDIFEVAQLNFEKPDYKRFPCLNLARKAAESKGTSGAILNAANEVAVEYFLGKKIGFSDIAVVVENVLNKTALQQADSLNRIIEADRDARRSAVEFIKTLH